MPAAQQTAPAHTVGGDIRALRKGRGMTLVALAEAMGRSTGWLSHVERGQIEPGIADLKAVAQAFAVPLSLFFRNADAPAREHGRVVRAGARTRLGTEAGGLVEELLSADLAGPFEMIRSCFSAGAESGIVAARPTVEAGYVISGKLDLWIGPELYKLTPGDAFQFENQSYRWRNPGSTEAVLVWVVSPPVY